MPAEGSGASGVGFFLFATTVLASWVPARRALGVDPLDALRSE